MREIETSERPDGMRRSANGGEIEQLPLLWK